MACQAFVSVDAFLGDPLGLGSCDDCRRPYWEHEREHRRSGATAITRDAKVVAQAQYERARKQHE